MTMTTAKQDTRDSQPAPKIHARITINNVVQTVVFGHRFDLAALNFPNTYARLGQFPALQFHITRVDGSRATALQFRTGSVTEPGGKSEIGAYVCTHTLRLFEENRITDRYRRFGWPKCGPKRRLAGRVLHVDEHRTVNVVASGDINEGINLDRMSADSCGSAIYHPHLFSAIKQGHTADPTPIANDKQCTNTFQTGKFNTMALKSEADAIRAAEQVILSLVKYVRPDVHPNPNTRYQDRLQRFTQPCVSIGTEAITLDNGDKITVDQFVHSISDII